MRIWNNDTRIVTDFTANPPISRPYTAEENASADAALAQEALAVNETTLREEARLQIETLLASIASLQVITDKTNAQIGPADTKTVARECRRVARQLVRLTRLLVGALDTTNAGPE